VIAAGRTRLLLDCGFSLRETTARLAVLGLEPQDITAIVITHEHDDHVGGLGPVARGLQVPVYLTAGTRRALNGSAANLPEMRPISPHERFAIDDIEVRPFPVPHDAREPAQFVFSDGAARLGFMTDVGSVTSHMQRALDGCEALVLECNHDIEALENGDYPPSLKARIRGERGHLDNRAAALLLKRLDTTRLGCLVAAHLSQKNNRPEWARAALAGALDCEPGWVAVADQDRGHGWRAVRLNEF
jgi:phosphoribosyl 1,2-cyclic phosphodiesterase